MTKSVQISVYYFTLSVAVWLLSACGNNDHSTDEKHNIQSPHGSTVVVLTGSTATLDAHNSHCSDDSEVIFSWDLKNAPSGSHAQLINDQSPVASLTSDKSGDYEATLVIYCSGTQSVAKTFIITASENPDDVINLYRSSDQHIKVGEVAHISIPKAQHGSNYEIVIIEQPSGSSVTLSAVATSAHSQLTANNGANAEFVAQIPGKYTVVTSVTTSSKTHSDTHSITVTAATANAVPMANAGVDQTIQSGQPVSLHGSGSHDADGDKLTYKWSINAQPAGSNLTINSDKEGVDFIPNVAGQYVIKLIVNDGKSNSAPDMLKVTVTALQHSASLHSQLLSFGLDSSDAAYLESHHKADAQAVIARTSGMFHGITINDAMFEVPSASDNNAWSDTQLVTWQFRHKVRFKKIFGRIKFLANSPKFEASFTLNVGLLDASHQLNVPTMPTSYAQFINDSSSAITAGSGDFSFYLSDRASGTAWGRSGLALKVERMGMIGDASTDGSTKSWGTNAAAGLIFHELTHSVDYAHDGTPVTLIPNNVPYFVQFIASYESGNMLTSICNNIQACTPNSPFSGPEHGLLDTYFGAD